MINNLDAYLTKAPEDYAPLYEAIYEAVHLPDNTEFDLYSQEIFDLLLNKCIYEEWSVERMVLLAKRYYNVYYKKYFESSFWYVLSTYLPEAPSEVKPHTKAIELIENLPFREMMDSGHSSVFYKITDDIKTRAERDKVFLLLTRIKCTYLHQC